MYAQKTNARQSAGEQSSNVLFQALAERDSDLGEHLEGVTELAVAVGVKLGVEPDVLHQLRWAARLHDVGKMAVPESILLKRGRLDEREWEFVRRHTIVGQRILEAAPSLGGTGAVVRSSHERWDGTGYPDGLAGEDIPLAARIIAVCDAFDAMVSDRPYRPALSAGEALQELARGAGEQFDPAVLTAFLDALAERPPSRARGVARARRRSRAAREAAGRRGGGRPAGTGCRGRSVSRPNLGPRLRSIPGEWRPRSSPSLPTPGLRVPGSSRPAPAWRCSSRTRSSVTGSASTTSSTGTSTTR